MVLNIRDIVHKDIDAVHVLARAMAHESPVYRTKVFSDKKVHNLLVQIVTAWATPLFGVVAEQDGMIIGFMCAGIQESFMSEEKYSFDYALFVTPEYRGGSAGIRMITRYEEWALSKGVAPEDIHLGISTNVNAERTVCLYERRGYKLVSYNMVKKGPE